MLPKGVSMRFPPANGLAGSVVWQLAQSPASVSALPCAIISAEGSDLAGPAASALHKSRIARIARIAQYRPCTICLPLGLYSAKPSQRECYVVSRQACAET